ncbi:hypothetical protein ACS0TY_033682 [Phlomoides rotata]
MELGLSLGDTPKPFSFLENSQKILGKDLGFCMGVAKLTSDDAKTKGTHGLNRSDPPVQLDLLPFSPVNPTQNKFPFSWLTHKLGGGEETEQETASPNSGAVSSFQMDFSIFRSARGKRDFEQFAGAAASNGDCDENRGASSRGSDEEENGINARKKLRLTKEQSAFLEDSFKEHNTLNPKQKLALAKQLNLRPRQVEVWFQNRRARTKLKQTEVDCEYLKRCCETLTEENRRLQKEVQELRALKASQPFYMQRPATTLTMCPSCERVVTTTTSARS